MKIDLRHKWRNVVSLSLDKNSTNTAIEVKWRSLTQAQSIKNYNFRISRFKIQPMLYYFIRVSFLTTLVIYKAYFRSRYTRIQRPRIHILYVKSLYLYVIGFCNQVLPNLHCLWSEEFCSQQQSFKLLELVTYWDPCKGVSHRLEICATKEKSLVQYQVQLGIRVKVQL